MDTRLLNRIARRTLCAALALPPSIAAWGQQTDRSFTDTAAQPVASPAADPRPESPAGVSNAVRILQQMELPQAGRALDAALQRDARNSYLHFFNGFIHHLQARQGDARKSGLAIESYQQALRLDPGNWIAQEFLGLAYLDLAQYAQAKELFAGVLLMSPDSMVSVYGLMVSARMTGDADMACAMAERFKGHASDAPADFTPSVVDVDASCGPSGQADAARVAPGQPRLDGVQPESVDWRQDPWDAPPGARPGTDAASQVDTLAALIQESIDHPPTAGHSAGPQGSMALGDGFTGTGKKKNAKKARAGNPPHRCSTGTAAATGPIREGGRGAGDGPPRKSILSRGPGVAHRPVLVNGKPVTALGMS